MRLLSVEDARARMLEGVDPAASRRVPLAEAVGRVLAEPVAASRDQPPFDASAMDGWAVRSTAATTGATMLRILGESAAGRPFVGEVGEGEAVRIFTGASVPAACDWVVPQEVATRRGDRVELGPLHGKPSHIRPRGGDFRAGQVLLAPGVRLDPWRLALAASAGLAEVVAAPRPRLVILSTGEEIVSAGQPAAPHQIFDAGGPALRALVEAWGGEVCALVHAGDDERLIARAVEGAGADLIVTIGGASVGDHDLVKPALGRLGLNLSVESVNVRPGKPTWFGRLGDERRVLGLPGNPASALVCAELFLRPLLRAWQGAEPGPALSVARLTHALPPTGPREHWMRAALHTDEDGVSRATAFPDQDSSLVTVFAQADALLRRPPGAPGAAEGERVDVLGLDRS